MNKSLKSFYRQVEDKNLLNILNIAEKQSKKVINFISYNIIIDYWIKWQIIRRTGKNRGK